MLTEDGRPKIVDFGLSKSTDATLTGDDVTIRAGALTDTYAVVGTAGYMAPEQVASRPMDFRADQFALGAIIYEMISGRRAFRRDTAVQTMSAIIDAEPESLVALCPDAPIELVRIVERCLAKDPASRYASTQDLARDLRDIQWTSSSRASRSAIALPRPSATAMAMGGRRRDPARRGRHRSALRHVPSARCAADARAGAPRSLRQAVQRRPGDRVAVRVRVRDAERSRGAHDARGRALAKVRVQPARWGPRRTGGGTGRHRAHARSVLRAGPCRARHGQLRPGAVRRRPWRSSKGHLDRLEAQPRMA